MENIEMFMLVVNKETGQPKAAGTLELREAARILVAMVQAEAAQMAQRLEASEGETEKAKSPD